MDVSSSGNFIHVSVLTTYSVTHGSVKTIHLCFGGRRVADAKRWALVYRVRHESWTAAFLSLEIYFVTVRSDSNLKKGKRRSVTKGTVRIRLRGSDSTIAK